RSESPPIINAPRDCRRPAINLTFQSVSPDYRDNQMRGGGRSLDERRPRFEAPQIVVNIVKNRAIKKETLERFGSIAQFIGQQFLRFKPPVSKQSLENRQVCSKHSWGEGLLIKANILLRPRRCADRPRYRAPNRVMFDRPPEQTNARLIFKA